MAIDKWTRDFLWSLTLFCLYFYSTENVFTTSLVVLEKLQVEVKKVMKVIKVIFFEVNNDLCSVN